VHGLRKEALQVHRGREWGSRGDSFIRAEVWGRGTDGLKAYFGAFSGLSGKHAIDENF